MFAATLTVKVAEAVALLLSVTVSVKAELVAVQEAATSAMTLPEASMAMLLTVTPEPPIGVALTTNVLAA